MVVRKTRRSPAAKRAARNRQLIKNYGITLEEYEAMRAAQGGLCVICRKGKTITLAVDHDHEIQKQLGLVVIRGLLCKRCNRHFVGTVEWDDETVRRGIAYLRKILALRQAHGVSSVNIEDEEDSVE